MVERFAIKNIKTGEPMHWPLVQWIVAIGRHLPCDMPWTQFLGKMPDWALARVFDAWLPGSDTEKSAEVTMLFITARAVIRADYADGCFTVDDVMELLDSVKPLVPLEIARRAGLIYDVTEGKEGRGLLTVSERRFDDGQLFEGVKAWVGLREKDSPFEINQVGHA